MELVIKGKKAKLEYYLAEYPLIKKGDNAFELEDDELCEEIAHQISRFGVEAFCR
jgi:hypothetical protein